MAYPRLSQFRTKTVTTGLITLVVAATALGTNVYSGSAAGTVNKAALRTTESSAFVGSDAASIGDVNSDGYADAAIAASGADNPNTGVADVGAVYVFLGGSTRESTRTVTDADAVIYGMDADASGMNVVGAGDVSGDGIDDVIVTESHATGADAMAYVLFGPLGGEYDLTSDADVSFNMGGVYGPTTYPAAAGDVDSDGNNDVLLSTPFSGSFGPVGYAGNVALFSGPFATGDALTTADATATISGYYSYSYYSYTGDADWLGRSMASIGDVNSDGYDDVAISADGRNRVYIFNGPLTGSLTYANASAEITLSTGSQLGYDIANVGDMNADGYTDLAVSDPYASSSTGEIYVVNGPLTSNVDLTTTYGARLSGEAASDYAGKSIAGIGDTNGDGYDDMVIGAPYNDDRASNAGAAYLVRGNMSGTASLSAPRFIEFTGRSSNDYYGYEVAGAGDIDGDARTDYIFGAYGTDAGAVTDAGAAQLFFGR